jgi:hypothetical protein
MLVCREGFEVTDDVSIVEYLKHPVFITHGSYANLKVSWNTALLTCLSLARMQAIAASLSAWSLSQLIHEASTMLLV